MARTKAKYIVAVVNDDGSLAPVMADGLDGLGACKKWILAEGGMTVTYQPIALLGDPVKVAVTMKRVAKFEASAEGGDGDDD